MGHPSGSFCKLRGLRESNAQAEEAFSDLRSVGGDDGGVQLVPGETGVLRHLLHRVLRAAAVGAQLLHHVTSLTPEILHMAGGAGSWRGTGGMAIKLSAAKLCMDAGLEMVITNGAQPERLYDIIDGAEVGTRFLAAKKEARV